MLRMCLCILASSRIPRSILRRRIPHFWGGSIIAFSQMPISGNQRLRPHHRGSHHPNYPHAPNKPHTHNHWIPWCCCRCEEARGPNGATIDPSGVVCNQHHCPRSPTFIVVATTMPQPRSTLTSQSSRWSAPRFWGNQSHHRRWVGTPWPRKWTPTARARAHGQTKGGHKEISSHAAVDRAWEGNASRVAASNRRPSPARAGTITPHVTKSLIIFIRLLIKNQIHWLIES
jgi:hypothetical protein